MPRLVRMNAMGPIKIEPSEKPIFVCACGLSQNFPICDGAHKACKITEAEAGKVFVYDKDRKAIVSSHDDEQTPPAPIAPQ